MPCDGYQILNSSRNNQLKQSKAKIVFNMKLAIVLVLAVVVTIARAAAVAGGDGHGHSKGRIICANSIGGRLG